MSLDWKKFIQPGDFKTVPPAAGTSFPESQDLGKSGGFFKGLNLGDILGNVDDIIRAVKGNPDTVIYQTNTPESNSKNGAVWWIIGAVVVVVLIVVAMKKKA